MYGLSLRSRSPKDGPQVRLHSVASPVDRLVTEGAVLVPHLLLAGPAKEVARDALGDLGGHFLETNRTLRLHNVVIPGTGSTDIDFGFNGF